MCNVTPKCFSSNPYDLGLWTTHKTSMVDRSNHDKEEKNTECQPISWFSIHFILHAVVFCLQVVDIIQKHTRTRCRCFNQYANNQNPTQCIRNQLHTHRVVCKHSPVIFMCIHINKKKNIIKLGYTTNDCSFVLYTHNLEYRKKNSDESLCRSQKTYSSLLVDSAESVRTNEHRMWLTPALPKQRNHELYWWSPEFPSENQYYLQWCNARRADMLSPGVSEELRAGEAAQANDSGQSRCQQQ